MGYPQGSLVVGPAKFRGGRRPFLVVSNERRPFHGEEYTVATVTTTARSAAVELAAADLAAGQLARYPSFVNPWSLHVIKHERIDKRVAQLEEDTLRAVVDGIRRFVGVE
jgi:mRNA-degrading endonuclease toxin of MazEF toxin-antitoxin module